MKLMSKVEGGEVRIDFNPNMLQGQKMQSIYEYFERQSAISKVTWRCDIQLLKSGIVLGYYNQFITTDKMAEKAAKNAIKEIERE